MRALHAASVPSQVDGDGNLVFEVVWDFLFSMSREHAETSFAQRRQRLVDGARRLKADVDSFNVNNPNAADDKMQMQFDFTDEVEMATGPSVDEVRPTSPPRKPR